MKIIKNLKFAGLAALAALAATLLFQTQTTRAGDHDQRGDDGERGDHDQRINKPFVTLLEGIYEPVAHVPDLGLCQFVADGSESKIGIYNIDSGVPSPSDKVFGTFYVQFVGNLCEYDFPKGNILAKFTYADDVTISFTLYPDPVLGPSSIFVGTEELEILEATGIYKSFVGGHIHMVDRLDNRDDDGTYLEHCFCHFSPKHCKP